MDQAVTRGSSWLIMVEYVHPFAAFEICLGRLPKRPVNLAFLLSFT